MVKQEILLITYPDKEQEAITRLSRVGYDHSIGFLKGGFESWKQAKKEYGTVDRITPALFAKDYNSGENLVFDIRKKSEFDSEHVIGAINVPLNELNAHLSEFPKHRPFILYCQGGYRSMIAASMLKQRGWEDFVDVDEGMDGIVKTDVKRSKYVCPTSLL